MSTKQDAIDILNAVSAFAPVAELIAGMVNGKPEAREAAMTMPRVAALITPPGEMNESEKAAAEVRAR